MGDLLKPRTDEKKVWTLEVDDHSVEAKHVKLTSRFGTIECGIGPEGYHRIAFAEPNFGGSVNVLYTVRDDGVCIAVIDMDRSDTMADNLCCPGMFVYEGETHDDVSGKILEKELGLNPDNYDRKEIGVVNPNRSIYVTPKGAGVHYYAVLIPDDQLVEGKNNTLVFKEGICKPPDAGLQQIKGVTFHPWYHLADCQDGFTATAIGLLVAHLKKSGRASLLD